ncbi:hypothetical protein CKO32_16975 [Afifella marina DSM 2698]|nr:hypothetical protein [Afifella marina DSM 2698]MBK1628972.1 hypothetical protein [Afifella marina]MBK5918351.1 hypothetical protein [Afifella marina]RAI22866.1 hypothetical protein CH311_04235 [Afifella marina DSM 2698]
MFSVVCSYVTKSMRLWHPEYPAREWALNHAVAHDVSARQRCINPVTVYAGVITHAGDGRLDVRKGGQGDRSNTFVERFGIPSKVDAVVHRDMMEGIGSRKVSMISLEALSRILVAVTIRY